MLTLFQQIQACQQCHLSQEMPPTCKPVMGQGPIPCKLMLVGEALGANEALLETPFVGASGQLLNKMLSRAGLIREEVYVTNVVKCLNRNTFVYFADGTKEKIDHIVKHRINKPVICVDFNGNITSSPIIGWYKNNRDKRKLYRINYQYNRQPSIGKRDAVLTEDHMVLTRRGYIRIDSLLPTDEIATGKVDFNDNQSNRTSFEPVQVSEFESDDNLVYCIDVETYGNFLTQGGIVHNCRPTKSNGTGNRIPNAEEIQACKPWLWKEIQLVQPVIIVTMGKIATGILLSHLKGITIHDVLGIKHSVPWTTAQIVPIYHPSYILQYGRLHVSTCVEILSKIRESL